MSHNHELGYEFCGMNFCEQTKLLPQVKWLDILVMHWDGMQQGKKRINGFCKK